MMNRWLAPALAGAILTAAGCASTGDREPQSPPLPPDHAAATPYTVPVAYETLDNGLKVVVSPDSTAPVVTVAVYYNVGLRTEPRGLTGFAHLFEHMMFQGSANLPKGAFDQLIQGNGGVIQGQTKPDVTLYYEVVPAHMLEPVLWAEADRMGRLAVTAENLDNQREVVKNEYRVKIENQPYSRFLSVELSASAFENWHNGHNFWGEMEDLDAATVESAEDFYRTYYAPNNAVVVIVGDVDPETTLDMVKTHFGDLEPRPRPAMPDLSEPRQTEEKTGSFLDPLAPQPMLAFAYHAPPPNTDEYFAMELINLILLQGADSLLYERIVTDRGYSSFVGGGLNIQGNLFDVIGPVLFAGYLVHDLDVPPSEIVAEIDDVIESFRSGSVDPETLSRAKLKFRSGFYETQGGSFGIGRADLLAAFALFRDDPTLINRIEQKMDAITPELIARVAREYLRSTNRTLLYLEPGAAQRSQP
jgi:predicted Zn-dependent peptidase